MVNSCYRDIIDHLVIYLIVALVAHCNLFCGHSQNAKGVLLKLYLGLGQLMAVGNKKKLKTDSFPCWSHLIMYGIHTELAWLKPL